MAVVRRLQERRGWAYSVAVAIVKPTLLTVTKREWIDGEKIPATGGCVIAVNHISKIDPLTLAHFVYNHGRLVRFLAKDGLWKVPVLKNIVSNARQIPVARMSSGAANAFEAAVDAVHDGECLGIYVEGSITRDPDGWPMRGKTGAARIALTTGCPVIPVGQWGAQELLPAYSKKPSLVPRHTMHYKAGDPVDLSEFEGKPLTNELLHAATDTIMAAITELVEDLRGEKAPAERFDPKASGVDEIGNYKREKRGHDHE
ncbi:MAG TPA: lysophospholipid acyltransferase family protein [Marmoricola sp.]